MNVLHLVLDQKFIDFFADTMDAVDDCCHKYLVYTPRPEEPLRYLQSVDRFEKVGDAYFKSAAMRNDLSQCDVLFVHFLTRQAASMITAAPSRVKVVWSGWGADYYYTLLPGGEGALLGEDTREIIAKVKSPGSKSPLVLARRARGFLTERYFRRYQLYPAVGRVDYFSSPIPEDYDSLCESLGDRFSAEYKQINYGSLEETFAVGSSVVDGGNILVGNSSDPTNNHMEVFMMLEKIDLADRKVIVPLSYGNLEYQKAVLDLGRNVLGSAFHPIVNYLPLVEYNKLIASCSYAIMNHMRQQALGNIGAALYGGAKVFVNGKSNTFKFFKSRGAYIYDIDDLVQHKDKALSGLTCEQKSMNIAVLDQFWGKEKVRNNFLDLMNFLKINNRHITSEYDQVL